MHTNRSEIRNRTKICLNSWRRHDHYLMNRIIYFILEIETLCHKMSQMAKACIASKWCQHKIILEKSMKDLHMKRVSSCKTILGIITVGFCCLYILLSICQWPSQMYWSIFLFCSPFLPISFSYAPAFLKS